MCGYTTAMVAAAAMAASSALPPARSAATPEADGEQMRRGHHAAGRARFRPAGGGSGHGAIGRHERDPTTIPTAGIDRSGTFVRQVPTVTTTNGSALEVLAAATRLGLTSFGGPIAHLGYFRDEYVVRRKWVDEQAYADLVALCQFLPGPASSQVGMALGFVRAGLLGGLAAWLGFTLPSAIALIAFAIGVRGLDLSGAGWLHGLKIARRGRRRAGRLGNGAGAVPGPRARDDGHRRRHRRLCVAHGGRTGGRDCRRRGCRPVGCSRERRDGPARSGCPSGAR